MLRKQIQVALEAAAQISPHRHFVIAGSLSVLGFKETPPEMMSMSIDIDFFPLRNPEHVAEIAKALGEDSEFHETHGYYLDPISPELPVLPTGWRERLVEVKLGAVYAYFLEVHDTAISKYARGAENDYRWIDAGYLAGILNFNKIESLARFSMEYPDPDDQNMVRKGIESHRAAFLSNGTLNNELLAYLRSDEVVNVMRIDRDDGCYHGKIVWSGNGRVVQMIRKGEVVVHDTQEFGQLLQLDQTYSIDYENSQVKINEAGLTD